jgi:PadR family transcriptional regulator PadR
LARLFLHLGNKIRIGAQLEARFYRIVFIEIHMKKYPLGEFEEIVILTIAVVHKGAYGVAIKKEIESRLKRNVSMGAMHTALVRLEDKGYIRSFDGDSTEERAGRPRKYFELTALGKKAIAFARSTREGLWDAIPKAVWEFSVVGLVSGKR